MSFRRKIGSLPQKKGKGKLPIFHGNGEQVILIYVSYNLLMRQMVSVTAK